MLLAQATPPIADWVTTLSEIGKSGLLGLLLVLALWVIRKLYIDLNSERTAHLEDTKAMTELIRQSTEATTKWVASQDDRNRALEDMAKALNQITVLVHK